MRILLPVSIPLRLRSIHSSQVHTHTNLHHLRTRFFSIQLIPAVAHILEQWRKNEMLSHVTNADDDDRYGYDDNADDTTSSSLFVPALLREIDSEQEM